MNFRFFEGILGSKITKITSKSFFVDFDSNKLFLLKMNTFLVVFSKKQHRGTPKVTRTQKMDSHYPTGKGNFWSSQSDLGLKI